MREGCGGVGMSLSCHTHPCPGLRRREGQKALRESQKQRQGERDEETLGTGGQREARVKGK